MRVLYSFPQRLGTPGIGMTAWHQVQGLAELGVRVTLFCGSVERPLRGLERIVETMKVGPVRLSYRAMGMDRAMAWHDRRVAAHLRRTAHQTDLLHCWPSGSLKTLKVAKACAIPSVLERPSSHTAQVYEVVARECESLGMEMPVGHYGFWNKRRLAREEAEFQLADALLCPSASAARTFLDRGYDAKRLILHQYGYDPSAFTLPAQAQHRGSRRFSVVFVGECSPLKALHVALKAWFASGASEDGRFLICGKFVAGYREALAGLIDHPSVECMGFVSDVSAVMRESDALVHSSLSEGSALVCYEAQACGLALLVSDAAGARCIHEVDALIHPAGDTDTLTAHLRRVSSDPALADRLRNGSLARAKELTWTDAAKRLQAVYAERVAAVAPRFPAGTTAQPSHA
jgi:glycosyltransferase involved in cell wall biosynthesis